jgi:hypothetical protein
MSVDALVLTLVAAAVALPAAPLHRATLRRDG